MHPIVKEILSSDLYTPSKHKKSISASMLGNSVQEIILSKRHKTTVDIKLNCASLLGTGLHLYCEQVIKGGFEFELDNEKWKIFGCEIPMESKIEGTNFWLTGTSDIVAQNLATGVLRIMDYKTCKDYGLKNNKKKWASQMGIYSLLASLFFKKEVDNIGTIIYFNKTAEASSKFAMGHLDLQLPGFAELRKIILDKASLLDQYWDSPSDQLPQCSTVETWNGRKCNSFCHVAGSKYCNQLNSIMNEEINYDFSSILQERKK